MTAILLPVGTLVTFEGIAGVADGRHRNPPGYWIKPMNAGNGPATPFPVSDLQIEKGLADGSFRMGADKEALPDDHALLATVDPRDASDRDKAVKAYRQCIVDAIQREIDRNPKALRRKRQTFERIAASIEPPEGVERILGASVERIYNKFLHSGCDAGALYPRNKWKGNREPRKPDFALEAVEQAIDNKYRGHGTLPDVLVEAIRIARQNVPTDLSPYSRQVILKDGTARQESMIPRLKDGGIDWEELITYPIVRRALKRRDAIDMALRIHGPVEGRRKMRVVGAGPVEGVPLALCETDDCWLSQLFVVDDENWFPLGYPSLTAIIDVATRAVPGFDIGFMPPSSDSVGRALKQAIMPKDLSWAGKHPDGTPIIGKSWSMFGKITELKCDQGGGFISKHTRDAAYRCGSSLTVLPPASPQLKPYIERFFGTVKRGRLASALGMLPKTLLEGLAKSGKRGRKDPVLITLRELRLLITYWIVEVYHQEPHRGHGMPPQEVWDTLTAEMKVLPPPTPEEAALLVGKYEPSRVLNANGVRMFGLEYNSDALGALRERTADPETGILRGVEIKYDPADIWLVWVIAQDPDSPKSTIAVPAYCKQMRYAKGLSEYQHMVIKAHARAQSKKRILTVEQLMKAKQELAEIARKMIGDRNAGGGAIKLARYLNVNRAYLYDPNGLDDAEASARFLALVDDEPVEEDEADTVPARRRSVAAPPVESPEEVAEDLPDPVGTAVLRAEASAGRRNLGVIRDE